jgi:hypothetical protein
MQWLMLPQCLNQPLLPKPLSLVRALESMVASLFSFIALFYCLPFFSFAPVVSPEVVYYILFRDGYKAFSTPSPYSLSALRKCSTIFFWISFGVLLSERAMF